MKTCVYDKDTEVTVSTSSTDKILFILPADASKWHIHWSAHYLPVITCYVSINFTAVFQIKQDQLKYLNWKKYKSLTEKDLYTTGHKKQWQQKWPTSPERSLKPQKLCRCLRRFLSLSSWSLEGSSAGGCRWWRAPPPRGRGAAAAPPSGRRRRERGRVGWRGQEVRSEVGNWEQPPL